MAVGEPLFILGSARGGGAEEELGEKDVNRTESPAGAMQPEKMA